VDALRRLVPDEYFKDENKYELYLKFIPYPAVNTLRLGCKKAVS